MLLTIRRYLLLALCLGACADEPALSPPSLPAGHGPGAMGPLSLIKPVLDEYGSKVIYNGFMFPSPLVVADFSLPEGAPADRESRLECEDRETKGVVLIYYRALGGDRLARERDPVYGIGGVA